MNRCELFDKIFTEKRLSVEYNGQFCEKRIRGNSVDFLDPETGDPMITITQNQILCSECGVELGYNDCEMLNYRTLKLICPECFFEYKIIFPQMKQVNMSEKVESITEGSIYLATVGGKEQHVIYTDDKFLCVEEDDKPVNPELLIEEVFLSNSEIADLRPVSSSLAK